MINSPLPDELQTLAAGYVLGDLSSEEMAQFQRLLSTHPELNGIVASLQETLSLLPYGLPPQIPDAQVRSSLLGTAKSTVTPLAMPSSRETLTNLRQRPAQPHNAFWSTRWAAALVVGLGGCSLWLSHRVFTLQAQLKTVQHFAEIAVTDSTTVTEPELTISPADVLLRQQWSGLSQLVQDHLTSLMRSQGPVDVAAKNPNTLLGRFPLSDQIPAIASPQATLLGGSHCQFGKAKGIRLTYQLTADQTVSVYQIDLEGEQFPQSPEVNVTLNHRNVNLILWREEDYLYALAAELSLTDLQTLAQTMEPI